MTADTDSCFLIVERPRSARNGAAINIETHQCKRICDDASVLTPARQYRLWGLIGEEA